MCNSLVSVDILALHALVSRLRNICFVIKPLCINALSKVVRKEEEGQEKGTLQQPAIAHLNVWGEL